MARATRRPAGQALRVGLLIAAPACAAVQEPPGGPPDTTPPAIDSTRPDSGAVVPGWRDAAVIRFNEVIDERSGGSLDKLITLSPVPEELSVAWKRTAIEVRPKGGWREGAVYQLTLLPGIQDLRGNRSTQGRTVVFSTGGDIPATRISGAVLDWEQGRIAARALIEAVQLPDSLRYVGIADSVGEFVMGSMPTGRYHLLAGVDANNNRRFDVREPFDSLTVQLDSTVSHTFWAFKHDTLGPGLSRVAIADSATLRLELTQVLPPEPLAALAANAVTVLALPDSAPVTIASVWRLAEYDSLTAAERGRRGPAADTTVADTARAAEAADTAGRPPAPGQRGETARPRPSAADTSRAARLLGERPKLSNVLMVRLEQPLAPGGRYLVLTNLPNLLGVRGAGRQVLVVPERAK
ncbi:MAG: Ig-like domain-containing protein [Gemmatimonadetes bacterium]|nr:Ig-like domain-containing protein [Gemmatimonadota bacterium]